MTDFAGDGAAMADVPHTMMCTVISGLADQLEDSLVTGKDMVAALRNVHDTLPHCMNAVIAAIIRLTILAVLDQNVQVVKVEEGNLDEFLDRLLGEDEEG